MILHKALRTGAAVLVTVAATATQLQASTTDPAAPSPAVRVVNNHDQAVTVYVISEDGRRHFLGSVNRTQFRAFDLPSEARTGRVQVEVLPRTGPAGLGVKTASQGIQTARIAPSTGKAIQIWIEPELRSSVAHISEG